ncbi:ATPase [Pseudomonas chlororaphis]|uniref:ATPase n=1 Tax=Pseudomonas chlororaphis TaxID=587753 RepID=UPI001F079317|nr:ATPase [Pseudomonas chlororaphis]WDH47263.1 ATPase [Pseudomonas chlororaphis]WDH59110.1 ATPase [Pseudomonas chlororaphis]WQE18366.1 ATPase [Pseudomonas chlororaphis]
MSDSPGLKARDIAKVLNCERRDVTKCLYDNLEDFVQDENFVWLLKKNACLQIEFTASRTWITQEHFERSLSKHGSPLDCVHGHIVLKIPKERKVLFCAAARILALANQLAKVKRVVELDFSENPDALSYLNRAGFFDRLDKTIKVLPRKPTSSTAKRHKANNTNLVELLPIDADSDESVPERFKLSFAEAFGELHANKLFTVLGELIGNAEEHSETVIPGFAGLQSYKLKGSTSIVAVVSDSGRGICSTLRPALDKHYPDVAAQFPKTLEASDAQLIIHAMRKGGLSQRGKGNGGAGLRNSLGQAESLNAKISIRQEDFSVSLTYKDQDLHNHSWCLGLPKLHGTHIVFEFNLTDK